MPDVSGITHKEEIADNHTGLSGHFMAKQLFLVQDYIKTDPTGRAVYRRRSVASRLLGLRVRIPPGAWLCVF